MKMIDAYVDRFAQFGDRRDLQEAEVLRRRVQELKEEIKRAESLAPEEPQTEPTQHSERLDA